MAVNPRHVVMQQKVVETMGKDHVQPAIVYLLLGLVCFGFWLLGTSTQVITSESWMMHQSVKVINVTAYSQLWQIITTQHSDIPLAPFSFGWGVQLALIVGAIGVELPRKPRWRFQLARNSCIVLIAANSCGDWAGSAEYGFWGQCGFTAVIFFLTFVMLIFAIMSFKHAFALARVKEEMEEKEAQK